MRRVRSAAAAAAGPVSLLLLCAVMGDTVTREASTRGAAARESSHLSAIPDAVVAFAAGSSVFKPMERVGQISSDGEVSRPLTSNVVITSDSPTRYNQMHDFAVTRKSVTGDGRDPATSIRGMVSDSIRHDVVASDLLHRDATGNSGQTVRSIAGVTMSVSEHFRNSPQDISDSSRSRECPKVSVKFSHESGQEKSSRTIRHFDGVGFNKQIANINEVFKDDGRKKPPDKFKTIVQNRTIRSNERKTDSSEIPRDSFISVIAFKHTEFETDKTRNELSNVEHGDGMNSQIGNSRNQGATNNNPNKITSNIVVKTMAVGEKWYPSQRRPDEVAVVQNTVKTASRTKVILNNIYELPGMKYETNDVAVNAENKGTSINLRHLATSLELNDEPDLVGELKNKVTRNIMDSTKNTIPPFSRSKYKFYNVLKKVMNKTKTHVMRKHVRASRDYNDSDLERTVDKMDNNVVGKVRRVRSVSAGDERVKAEWSWANAEKDREEPVIWDKIETDVQDESLIKGEMHASSTENIPQEVGKIEHQVVLTSMVQDVPDETSETLETRVKIETHFTRAKESKTEGSSNMESTEDPRDLTSSTSRTSIVKIIPTNEQENDYVASESTESHVVDATQRHIHSEAHHLHEITFPNGRKYVANNDYIMLTPNGTESFINSSEDTSEAYEKSTEIRIVDDMNGSDVDKRTEIPFNANINQILHLDTGVTASHVPFTSISNTTIQHQSPIQNITVVPSATSGSTERSRVANQITSTLPSTTFPKGIPPSTAESKVPHSQAETASGNMEEMLALPLREQKIVTELPTATEETSDLAMKEVRRERPEVKYATTQQTKQEIKPFSGIREVIPLKEVIEAEMRAPKVEYISETEKTWNGKTLESGSFVTTNDTESGLELGNGTIEKKYDRDRPESINRISEGASINHEVESKTLTTEGMSGEQLLNSRNITTERLYKEQELESKNSTTQEKHSNQPVSTSKLVSRNATRGEAVIEDDSGAKPNSTPNNPTEPMSTLAPGNSTPGVEVIESSESSAKSNSTSNNHTVPMSTLAPENATRGVEVIEDSDSGAKPNSTANNHTVPMSTLAPENATREVEVIEDSDSGANPNSTANNHTVPTSTVSPGNAIGGMSVSGVEGSGGVAGSLAATAMTRAASSAAAAPPQFDLLDRNLACARADELSGPANPSRCTYEWEHGGDLPIVRCDLVAAVNGDNQNITALISNSGKYQALASERTPSGRLCLYPVAYTVVRSEALGELSDAVLRDDPLLETLRSERDKQTLTVVLSHGFRQVALRLRHDAIGPRGLLNADPCRGCTPEVWIFQYKKDISVATLYLNRAFGLSMLFEPAYVNLAKFWLQRLKPEAFLEELEVHGGESWGNPGTDLLPALSRLRRVDLSENGISEIPVENFERNPWIQELLLARNKFSTVPAGISLLTNLRILDLAGNLLTTQGLARTLQPLIELRALNLSYVPIKDFEVLSPEFVSHETSYEIDNLNSTTSYSDMLPRLEVLDVSRGSIRSVNSPVVQRLLGHWPRMRELSLARNPLRALLADLPARLPALRMLNLSGCGLRSSPALRLAPGQRLQHLDLSSNSLENPERLLAADAAGRGVADVNLHGNPLCGQWAADAFATLGANSSVDLSGTELALLDEDMLAALQALREVDLGDNPIDCSRCTVLALQRWLGQAARPRVLVRGEDRPLSCRYPASERGRRVVDLRGPSIDACRQASGRQGVMAAVCVAVVVAAGGALALLALRFRLELTYVVHVVRANYRVGGARRSGHSPDAASDTEFDAFVCYSKHDRAWVLGELLPRLEGSHPRYRLCLHERDFPLGSLIVQNIVECMERSRRTLMVLTPSFVESQWCQWELEMATHRVLEGASDFLVLVELEKLEVRTLPRLLRILLETRTFLEWPSSGPGGAEGAAVETAWQRLRAALGPPLSSTASTAATQLPLQPPPASTVLEVVEMVSFAKIAGEEKYATSKDAPCDAKT